MFFEDFKIGLSVEIEPVKIKKCDILDFAKKYEDIPIHTDDEYAKESLFGEIIAPGVMAFMSVWAQYLKVDMYGKELLAGKSRKIEWYKPVYADDVLKGTAVVTKLTRRNEKNGIVEITMDVYNGNEELVMTGTTEAIIKCRI